MHLFAKSENEWFWRLFYFLHNKYLINKLFMYFDDNDRYSIFTQIQ